MLETPIAKMSFNELINQFTISDVVTWYFFVGRQCLFKNDYKLAVKFLEQAFHKCPNRFFHNKQTILIYLLPAAIFTGKFPKQKILDNYNLSVLGPIFFSIRQGNIKKFNETLVDYKEAFEKGVYLSFQKLLLILYRNLFKKTAFIVNDNNSVSTKIKLQYFHSALVFSSGHELSFDETQCIVTNLIASKYIRGYMSQEHKLLVLAKENAFPHF